MCDTATHEWITLWEKSEGSFFVNRRCKRCGIRQHGDYDPVARYIQWNTHNESSDAAPEQAGRQAVG